ncbi:LysR family transcriptional regulator [Janthinobacterium sp. B9-8]|uniref:LysR family transcriptional regulator n=1 Tax=Janthinobacterium sp. B9-8 TaxID=1236179 RepID=UPI00061D1DCA|nr:LysR family transcriptional regulator [Janthinobacterium sp. B9-8]AMC35021.1 LysR family transcriptional regulator [Janthinobacterium sp. B9-8]
MLHLDALLTFVTIVDTGSFSAAAERLGQTPSGVSRCLSRLEKQLGISLISRTTRRLDLTEEGRWLLDKARQILASLAETEATLTASQAQPSGLLRVNAATPVLNHLIAPLAAGFMAAYPKIQLELIGAEAVINLIEERADVAIRIGELSDSTLNARRLGESQLRLVASPGYLQQHGSPLNEDALTAHSLLGFSSPASLNIWPLNGGSGMAISPTISASSGETLRHLALNGAGIACLADFLIGKDLQAGQLQTVLGDASLPWKQTIWAVFYKQGTLAPRIACFVDYLAKALA